MCRTCLAAEGRWLFFNSDCSALQGGLEQPENPVLIQPDSDCSALQLGRTGGFAGCRSTVREACRKSTNWPALTPRVCGGDSSPSRVSTA